MKFTESLVIADGSEYKGYLNNNVKEGPGVQVFADKSKYEGEWKDNKFNGKGKLIHKNGDVY